jgi:hypothetical protein
VMKSDGSEASNTSVGESLVTSGWNCTQSNPGFKGTLCPNGGTTDNAGELLDMWSLSQDGFSPVGCGENVTDEWQACASTNFGHLAGYAHTNAISINGVVNPPNQFTRGTQINP